MPLHGVTMPQMSQYRDESLYLLSAGDNHDGFIPCVIVDGTPLFMARPLILKWPRNVNYIKGAMVLSHVFDLLIDYCNQQMYLLW